MSTDNEMTILVDQVDEFDANTVVEMIAKNKQAIYLKSLQPEVREARNFLSFYGFIPWDDVATFDKNLLQKENWFKENITNRFFYDTTKLPDDGKYVVIYDNLINLVCVCDYWDSEKHWKKIEGSIASYISFLNIHDRDGNKLFYRVIPGDYYENGKMMAGDQVYASVFTDLKRYKNKAVINYFFVPLFKSTMELMGLEYIQETLEDNEEEVEMLLGFKHG